MADLKEKVESDALFCKKVKKCIKKSRLPCKIRKLLERSDIICKKVEECIPRSTVFCNSVETCIRLKRAALLANPQFTFDASPSLGLTAQDSENISRVGNLIAIFLNRNLGPLTESLRTGDYDSLQNALENQPIGSGSIRSLYLGTVGDDSGPSQELYAYGPSLELPNNIPEELSILISKYEKQDSAEFYGRARQSAPPSGGKNFTFSSSLSGRTYVSQPSLARSSSSTTSSPLLVVRLLVEYYEYE